MTGELVVFGIGILCFAIVITSRRFQAWCDRQDAKLRRRQ